MDPAGDRRYFDLRADHRLVETDRKVECDIVSDALELRVRAHLDLDQRISRLATAETRAAFAFQSQHLSIDDALRNREVQHAAFRHGDALAGSGDGLHEVDLERVAHIAATDATARPRAARTSSATEDFGENIGKPGILHIRSGPAWGARAAPTERTAGRPLLLVSPRLAGSVDFATVVALALLGIAQQLVGGRDLLEAFHGRAVTRIEIGMQFLRQLAKRTADVVFGGVLGNAQECVGIFCHGSQD